VILLAAALPGEFVRSPIARHRKKTGQLAIMPGSFRSRTRQNHSNSYFISQLPHLAGYLAALLHI
jgi:hypothetical protein